jgi:hypothetical protein
VVVLNVYIFPLSFFPKQYSVITVDTWLTLEFQDQPEQSSKSHVLKKKKEKRKEAGSISVCA